jgi:hypothetical protein
VMWCLCAIVITAITLAILFHPTAYTLSHTIPRDTSRETSTPISFYTYRRKSTLNMKLYPPSRRVLHRVRRVYARPSFLMKHPIVIALTSILLLIDPTSTYSSHTPYLIGMHHNSPLNFRVLSLSPIVIDKQTYHL